jgi:hypothetical protein
MISLEKLTAALDEMESQKGRISFFGLFLRETSNDRWDLVVAASWLRSDRWDDLKYVSKSVTSRLSKNEVVELARVIVVDEEDPGLMEILNSYHAEGMKWMHVANQSFFGHEMKHAYFFRLEHLPKSAAK